MTAAELYKLWEEHPDHPLFTQDSLPLRAYYALLRRQVYQELTRDGICPLADALAQAQPDTVTWHALFTAADAAAAGRQLAAMDPNRLSFSFTRRPTWQELNYNYYTIGQMYAATQQDCAALRNALQAARARHERRTAQPKPAEAPAQKEAADVQAEAEKLLTAAREQAERQRKQILADANAEAKLILEAAHQEAARIRQEAAGQAQEEAKAQAQQLVRGQLSEHIAGLELQWLQEQEQTNAMRADVRAETAALKEQLCNYTNAAGAELDRSMDAALRAIEQARTQLMSQLQQWRSTLYRTEYGPLVNFYNNLEAVEQRFRRDLASAELEGLTPEQAQSKLQDHSAKLSKLRSGLLRSMEALGIVTFTPQPGEPFDSYFHAVDDEEDDDIYHDLPIERCIRPGLMRTVNSEDTTVLHRATVTVKEDSHG